MSELEKFLEERSQFDIPQDDVARVKLLATELALGTHRDLWDRNLKYDFRTRLHEVDLLVFFKVRWQRDSMDHDIELLQAHGFADDRGQLSRDAFGLLQTAEPHKVFVSYKHSESSAFALLVVAKLKEFNQQAYCDMRLAPGDPWHPELEDQVRASKFVVVLLGPTTLCSGAVTDEIEWVIDAGAAVIPITHNGFDYKRKDWEGRVSDGILDTIERNHRIPIPKEHENAAGYDIAIRTLLVNRFGVSL